MMGTARDFLPPEVHRISKLYLVIENSYAKFLRMQRLVHVRGKENQAPY